MPFNQDAKAHAIRRPNEEIRKKGNGKKKLPSSNHSKKTKIKMEALHPLRANSLPARVNTCCSNADCEKKPFPMVMSPLVALPCLAVVGVVVVVSYPCSCVMKFHAHAVDDLLVPNR